MNEYRDVDLTKENGEEDRPSWPAKGQQKPHKRKRTKDFALKDQR